MRYSKKKLKSEDVFILFFILTSTIQYNTHLLVCTLEESLVAVMTTSILYFHVSHKGPLNKRYQGQSSKFSLKTNKNSIKLLRLIRDFSSQVKLISDRVMGV